MKHSCKSCEAPINHARSGSDYCWNCRLCSVCSQVPARNVSRDERWPGHWCGNCYQQFRNHGDPTIYVQPKGLPLAERFAQYVGEPQADGCIPWTGAIDSAKGYGRFRYSTQQRGRGAHIVALEIASGEPADGRHALHSCDNPPCVNPAHLRWGTNADNISDKMKRGRTVARLTPAQVQQIRDLEGTLTRSQVSRAFGVSADYVRKIQRGLVRS